MGFGLEYTLNGRRVTERQFLDGLEKQAVDQALSLDPPIGWAGSVRSR